MNPAAKALSEASAAEAAPGRAGTAAWYALAVLALVSLFAFVDRQVFILQAQPIKEHLRLSDFQLGLLQGVGIALFAAIVGYPLGWLADRFDRRWMLCLCVAVWSAAVAACGLADSFTGLFVASAVVGAGEAGITPIVFALIPELFKGRQRIVANSTFAVVTRLGIGLAIAFCGQLVHWVEVARPHLPAAMQAMEGWRLTFLAAALPAPLMLLLILSIRVGRHQRSAAAPEALPPAARPASGGPSIGAFLRAHRRSFGGFYIGIGLAVFGFASIMSWVPVITMRMYGESATSAGNATGAATFVATALGFAFSIWGIRWLEPRLGVRLPMVVLWASSLLAAFTTLVLLWTTSAMQIYLLQGVQYAFAMAGIMLYPTGLQNLCPAPLRSRLVAINGVVSVVCGALSPVVVGAVSDQLKHRPDGLLLAAVWVGVVSLLLAALVLRWGTTTYADTVRAAEAAGAR